MSDQDQTPSKPKGAFGRFLALPPDSVPKTIFIAVSVCLVASMVVSAAAVALRPVQAVNALKDKQVNVLQVAGIYDPKADVAEAFKAFEQHVLNLETGEFDDTYDIETYSDLAAAEDPALVRMLENDPAGLGGQMLSHQLVYILRDEAGAVDKVILPVKGYGLWSTLYGFVAVEENGNDIYGLQFYQHGETPGLGAEVDNPRWKQQWNGKKLHDDSGKLQITVAKTVPSAGPDHHVDALAGATLTSVGVDNLVRFWMGEQGYAAFLKRLKAGDI